MVLEGNAFMQSIGTEALKNLHGGLHVLQQTQQLPQQYLPGPAGSPGQPVPGPTALTTAAHGDWGPSGTASGVPNMLEVAAQLVVPVAQHVLASEAAGTEDHVMALAALKNAYDLVFVNTGGCCCLGPRQTSVNGVPP